MRYTKSIACLGFIPFFIAAQPASSPEILEVYPDCQYEVIKQLKRRTTFPVVGPNIDQEAKESVRWKLINGIRNIAKKQNADAIILTKSSVMLERETFSSNKAKVKYKAMMSAELLDLSGCESTSGSRPTPLDKEGKTQLLHSGKIKLEHKLEFAIDNPNLRHVPEITSSLVSINDGIYGIKLGSPIDHVEEKFGQPVLKYALSNSDVIYGYGRNLWLLFNEKKLVSAGNINRWFSHDLVNYIPFDERFDEKNWHTEGGIRKGTLISDALQKTQAIHQQPSKQIVIARHDMHLLMTYSGHIEKNNDIIQQINGFELRRPGTQLGKLNTNAMKKTIQKELALYLDGDNSSGLQTTDLNNEPLGSIWLDEYSQMLIYTDQMTALAKGKSIAKLHFFDNIFEESFHTPKAPWSFSRVHQGQTKQSLQTLLGDDAFAFVDEIQVTADKYLKNLYFEQKNGQYRLYAAEVSIY